MTTLRNAAPPAANDAQTPSTVCIACGAGAAQQSVVYQKWGYSIQKCGVCGLGKTLIDPNTDVLSIYDEGYFQGERKDGYSDYVGSEAVLRREFQHSLNDLRRYGRKDGRLLELGSAYGFFLAEAGQYFHPTGIEVSEAAVEFARSRGLKVDNGTLTADWLANREKFDAVVMLDVIEHLPDPAETLSLIWDALDMGGSLMISTGDWDSLLARVMGKSWRLMTPPQHLYFFSPSTLTHLLNRVGFEIVHLVKPWKTVSLGLIAYQVGSRIGRRVPALESINVGIPVNLFDAVRLVARKIPR